MRLVVLAITLVFIVLLGGLTAVDISRHGVTGVNVLGTIVVVLFAVGIVGALTERPRR